ncbi:hypothetical protein HDV01_007568, partial [Terramyces sp. JEL0728]
SSVSEVTTNEFQIFKKRDFRKPKTKTQLQESFEIQGIVDKNSNKYKRDVLNCPSILISQDDS